MNLRAIYPSGWYSNNVWRRNILMTSRRPWRHQPLWRHDRVWRHEVNMAGQTLRLATGSLLRKYVALPPLGPNTSTIRQCSIAQTIKVREEIRRKRSEALLGGGRRRIEAQHKKVRVLPGIPSRFCCSLRFMVTVTGFSWVFIGLLRELNCFRGFRMEWEGF